MEEKMIPIIIVLISSILAIILWHKKINPDITWIYAIYVILIVFIYLSAVKVF